MTGVDSKGCCRCIQRSVKCDEAKPKCWRCTKIGLDCPGYRPRELFQHHIARLPAKNASNYQLVPPSSNLEAQRPPKKLSSSGINSDEVTPDDYMSLYFSALYLPNEENCRRIDQNRYLYALPSLLMNENIGLSDVLIALTALLSGQHSETLQTVQRHFSTAIELLRRAIQDLHLRNEDGVLVAVSLLSMFELFQATSYLRPTTTNHNRGAQALLETRGPEAIQSSTSRLIFYRIRWASIFEGLYQRKSTPFATMKWLTVAEEDMENDAWVHLSSIMIIIPSLQEQVDHIKHAATSTDTSGKAPSVEQMIQHCESVKTRLSEWSKALLLFGHTDTVPLEEIQYFTSRGIEQPFNHVFFFPNARLAIMLSTYWLGKFILSYELASLQQIAIHRSEAFRLLSVKDLEKEALQSITRLCLSLPFLCNSSSKLVGKVDALPYLWFAKDFASANDPRLNMWCTWIEEIISQSGLRLPWPVRYPIVQNPCQVGLPKV